VRPSSRARSPCWRSDINATTFDAIVIGSGISGGWAAKELCEKGLKTLVLERGRSVEARKAPDTHWFGERAYFSSETGMTKALRYVRVPGHFTGCMPLAKGQPAWG
jgi:choline dehydrogenase-like flavoprotein